MKNYMIFFVFFTHDFLFLIFVYFFVCLCRNMELSNFGATKKMSREERRYSVPHGPNSPLPPAASEDLHAWSIYR